MGKAAQRLGVPDDEAVLYLQRLRRFGGVPISLDLTYVPRDIGRPTGRVDRPAVLL